MAEKQYDWAGGAVLEDHSRRKHKILREYFYQYLIVRCQLPQQTRFRLAVVDGFAGAGRYSDGSVGSPSIFLEEFRRAVRAISVKRKVEGFAPLKLELFLIMNDANSDAIDALKRNIAPLVAEARLDSSGSELRVSFMNVDFEEVYPQIKSLLKQGKYGNVIFNLDQCGHSQVDLGILADIMKSFESSEIFYTFAIKALLTFLSRTNRNLLEKQLAKLGLDSVEFEALAGAKLSKNIWLGTAERIVFESISSCAKFVSPFAINNPDGWRYWLVHLANASKARQVYNDLLHRNSTSQAHFGRSGLSMLAYDPGHENTLYLFEESDREKALWQLFDDIPRLLERVDSRITVSQFDEVIYNQTPAHSDDIRQAMVENPAIEVFTSKGGKRRSAKGICGDDIIQAKHQLRIFFLPVKGAG